MQRRPQSTVFSELHYLEEHIVKFVPKWKVGPGMMGEHGGESIYHQFNLLRNRFSSILEAASRSFHTIEEHHLTDCHSAPEPARKIKERLERGQFRIDDSPWHDCFQFFF